MKKDIEWLKDEIKVFQEGENMFTAEFNAGVQDALEYVQELIGRLDEPEVTLDRAFEKVAESYPMTKEEIWRHLERLETHGGKVTYDEPEVLSQEWIDENEQCITGHGADKNGMSQYHHAPFVSVYDLQNLLVPKQEEVTEKPVEAVKGYFKSVEKAKELLEELGYVVSEKPTKPVIPQFVADYIEKWKYEGLTIYEWLSFGNNDVDEDIYKWLYYSLNEKNRRREYLLIDAIRYGYEVEKEKRYYIIDKTNNSTLMTFELSDVVGEEVIEFVYGYSENETIHFNSKEKAEVIAHFVGESLEVEEVTE